METSTQEQEIHSPVSLKDVLLETTFSPGRILREEIDQIELGVFGDESKLLVEDMLGDSRQRERGKIVFITSDRKVLLQNQPTVGEEGEVVNFGKIEVRKDDNLPRVLRQNKFVGAAIHTHPLDGPPSITDMLSLLESDEIPSATSALFVATPSRNILVFRGDTTPQYSHDKIDFLEQGFQDLIDKAAQGMQGSLDDKLELHFTAQFRAVEDMVKTYGLHIFTGKLGEPIVKLSDSFS